MKKLIYDRKPSDKKSIKAKAAKQEQPDIIYLGQQQYQQQSDSKVQRP